MLNWGYGIKTFNIRLYNLINGFRYITDYGWKSLQPIFHWVIYFFIKLNLNKNMKHTNLKNIICGCSKLFEYIVYVLDVIAYSSFNNILSGNLNFVLVHLKKEFEKKFFENFELIYLNLITDLWVAFR